MSDQIQVMNEISIMEDLVARGFQVTYFLEDLYGAHIVWTLGEKEERLRILTADGRKYVTTFMISQGRLKKNNDWNKMGGVVGNEFNSTAT